MYSVAYYVQDIAITASYTVVSKTDEFLAPMDFLLYIISSRFC